MGERKPSIGRVDLPIPLNEFPNLNTLEAAKLYTLQVLEWANQKTKNGDPDLKKDFLHWLTSFKQERISGPIKAYKEVFRTANRIMPFIKSDVDLLMKKDCKLGYSSTMVLVGDDTEKPFEADAFLYENMDEPLEQQGQASEIQCLSCKSTDCDEIDIDIDSSVAVNSLSKFFTLLEQNYLIKDPQILVIGSGIGSFAYGAFLFLTSAIKIVSCEWEDNFCQLQEQVSKKYGMTGKVSVYNCIYVQDPGVLRYTDVTIICNRTRLLAPKHLGDLCQKLKQNLRRGSLLVTCSKEMKSYMMPLGQTEVETFDGWIKLRYQIEDGSNFDNFNSDSDDYKLNYYIYTVI